MAKFLLNVQEVQRVRNINDTETEEQLLRTFAEVSPFYSGLRRNFDRLLILVFIPEENCRCKMNSNTKKNVFGELDPENEFAIFSTKYEETVGVQVLYKLPKNGVLEEAIEALKKVQKNELNEEFRENETEFEKEFEFLKHDFGSQKSAKEDFLANFVSPDKFLFSKSDYKYDNFSEKPLENLLMTTDVEFNNYNHPLFTPLLDNDNDIESLNLLMFQEKDFEKPTKNLNIKTPPFQFYRRNMF